MLIYTLQRIGLSVLICVVSICLLFSAIHLIPGDPASIMLGSRATPELRLRLNHELGLDQPLPLQLVHFLGRVARGDLGTDLWSGRGVGEMVAENLPYTLVLIAAVAGDAVLDVDGMVADVAAYDGQIARGRTFHDDDQLRRIAQLRQWRGDRARTLPFQKIVDGGAQPLVAIRVLLLSRKSMGGMETDLSSRVLGRAGTPEEAITFGDAVFIAVPYKAYPDLAKEIGPSLKGKVVLDAGNATQKRDGALYDEVQASGIGATSAKYFAGAKLVRAFNAANYKVFAKEGADGGKGRAGGRMAIPIAGDDPEALKVAEGLVRDAGFDPVVVGPLKDADKFAMGSPGFGHDVTAPEMREKLGLAK